MKTVFKKNKGLLSEKRIFNNDGEGHCDDGPAVILYYENGNIEREVYLKNNQHHRDDGPAAIFYYENKSIEMVIYFNNDTWHRLDGPAITEYDNKGKITEQEFYYFDKRFSSLEELQLYSKCALLD